MGVVTTTTAAPAAKTTTVAVPTYGSKVTDAAGNVGVAKFNPNTGQALTNPALNSDNTRDTNRATGADISRLTAAYAASNALLQQQQAALAERRTSTIQDIKTESDIAAKAQEKSQAFDYAGRATSLVTSGGGFLGATQSQEGVLQNLKGTFDTEKTALLAKRDAAINAANAAYEDKDFALAKELANNAKDLQNAIYTRETDFANQQLKIASEKRAQTEFDTGVTKDKIQAYSAMSDAEFSKINPTDIAKTDALYYPGYTAAQRVITQKANNIKTTKDAISLDSDILDMRLKIPQGQKFSLGGVTYTGLKKPETSSTEVTKNKDNDIASIIIDFQNKIQKNGWAGIDPTAYEYYRNQLATLYGASAVLELDKKILDLGLTVDYGTK